MRDRCLRTLHSVSPPNRRDPSILLMLLCCLALPAGCGRSQDDIDAWEQQKNVPELIATLTDPEETSEIARAAAQALVRIGEPSVEPVLALFDNPGSPQAPPRDTFLASKVLLGISEKYVGSRDAQGITLTVKVLRAGDPWVHQDAVLLLKRFGAQLGYEVLADTVADIIGTDTDGSRWLASRKSWTWLAQWPELDFWAIEHSLSPDFALGEECIHELRQGGLHAAQFVAHVDAQLRCASVAATPYIILLLKDQTPLQWWVGNRPAGWDTWVLGLPRSDLTSPAQEASKWLCNYWAFTMVPCMAALAGPDEDIRKGISNVFDGLTDEGKVEFLIRQLRFHNEARVRRTAAAILGRLGDERAVKPLTLALEDKDLSVRQSATEALVEIGDVEANPRAEEIAP